MAYIQKKDTDGNKPLLKEGELGYDKYPAGGDEGRVYVGTGTVNIALSKKSEVDDAVGRLTVTEDRTSANTLVTGTASKVRYDKVLGNLDVVEMLYTGDDLTGVRYDGDDNSSVFYREVLSYVEGNLTTIKHYYGTSNLSAPSAVTTLSYDSSDNLLNTTYTE